MIGEQLKTIRKANKDTQLSLSLKLSVTQRTIASWESDDRNPDLEMLVKICELYSISSDYLLGIADKDYQKYAPGFKPEIEYAAHMDNSNKPVTEARIQEILKQAFEEYEQQKGRVKD